MKKKSASNTSGQSLMFSFAEMWHWSHGLTVIFVKGNGNPLQYPCLKNPMDREAWRAMVHRVAKSCAWLKRLSTQAGPSEVCSAPTASRELLLWTESQLNLPVVNIFLTSVPWMSYGHADLFILSVFKGTGGTQGGWSLQPLPVRENAKCCYQFLCVARGENSG